jgi:sarcosine oxidase, subunit beta
MPRHAPMIISVDPTRVAWTDEERAALTPSRPDLLEEMPFGAHGRPEGGGDSPMVLLLWTYHLDPVEPVFPMSFDPAYPEVTIRGMARMVPAFGRYADRLPRAVVDGGYYTKTRENRFLAGPLPVEGAYVCGALGGYGLMASNVAGELVASHITGCRLPAYASAFAPARYDDPAYRALLETWGDSGQL